MASYHFDHQPYVDKLVLLFKELESNTQLNKRKLLQLIKRFPKENGNMFAKDELVMSYRTLAGTHGLQPLRNDLIELIQKKPIRTSSGVAPITVLTKPFPCPGKCIFCPNDIRMPKSYLSDEPGAQRAERNYFDPYLQTYNRLQALHNIGHTINKAEIIILGGTWSYYPELYQIWFIKECFRALNEFGTHDGREKVLQHYDQMNEKLRRMDAHPITSDPVENAELLESEKINGEKIDETYNQVVSKVYTAPERIGGFDEYQCATWNELEEQQKINETAGQRNVGLVIETRPDNISEAEVIRIRRLGCTKAQIGFQSLNDDVLSKNNRGHDVAATRRAVKLLRQAGFKIHAHWMANLYGSSVEGDKKDYDQLFSDKDFRPDELKVYPCSLIQSAELMQYYKDGRWKPYSESELLDVVSHAMSHTPEYCRLTRIIRDIPSTDIVVGNKKTNFRQIAEGHNDRSGNVMKDIRAREIRGEVFKESEIRLVKIEYETSSSDEIFMQYVVHQNNGSTKILAFLRLSLPTEISFIDELHDAAIIREVHVYGKTVSIGESGEDKAQHLGLGTRLMAHARERAKEHGFKKLSVISAIGTREYYRKKGFSDGKLYQFMDLE